MQLRWDLGAPGPSGAQHVGKLLTKLELVALAATPVLTQACSYTFFGTASFCDFCCLNNNTALSGAWVALWVEHLTLDFGSRHDLTVYEFEPRVGLCADSAEPAWDPLPLPLPCSLSLSLSK